jgi:outer membrane protein
MSRSLWIAVLGAAVVAAPFVLDLGFPRAEASGSSLVIAVIDMERTLYETAAGKRADEKFEKARKKKQGELDKKQKELQKYAAELDKQASVLKADVLKTKKAELEKKFVELRQLYSKLEKDLAEERTKLVQDLLKQASPHIEKLAKEHKVSVIVDGSAIVWADKTVDLTDELAAKMK